MGVRHFAGHRSGWESRPASISKLSKGWFSPPLASIPEQLACSFQGNESHMHIQATAGGMKYPNRFLVVPQFVRFHARLLRGAGGVAGPRDSAIRALPTEATDGGACNHSSQTNVRAQSTIETRPWFVLHTYLSIPEPPFHARGWCRHSGTMGD